MGPTLQVVQCQLPCVKWLLSAAAVVVCAPSQSVGLGLPAACLRASVSSEEVEPPAQCPCHSPSMAMGIMGNSGLCREGSIPEPLLCCVLELAGGRKGPVCRWGLWGHSQPPTQSGHRQGCCLLFPTTELWARGGERTATSHLAARGPQLSDAT